MLFIAKLRHLRISPRKVRLIANLIKGLTVRQAEIQLKFSTKRSADSMLKLLKSAIANAEGDGKASKESLIVNNVTVDKGPTLKRWRPRAMGRASSIMKRTSHITLTLEQKGEAVAKNLDKKSLKKIKGKTEMKEENKKEKTLLEEMSKAPENNKKLAKDGKDDSIGLKTKQSFSSKKHSSDSKPKKKIFGRQSVDSSKKTFKRKSF